MQYMRYICNICISRSLCSPQCWWKWPPISCSSSDKAATINRRVILLLHYISNDINRPLRIFCYHNSRVGTRVVLPRKDEGPDRKGLLLTEDICFNMKFLRNTTHGHKMAFPEKINNITSGSYSHQSWLEYCSMILFG